MIGKIIAVITLIIGIYLTARFWLWIYKNAFGLKIDKKILIISFLIGFLASGSILLFPKIIKLLGIDSFINGNYSWESFLVFILYINGLILILNFIFNSHNKKGFLNLIFFNLIFIVVFLIFKNINLEFSILNIILYYLFIAYSEEILKNQVALGTNKKIGKINSDILLFHILAGIGFAFWENIIYLMEAISNTTFIQAISIGTGIVIMRGLLGFGAHTFYSSLIGMGNILSFKMIPIFVVLGIFVHYIYNLSLYFQFNITIPIFIIVFYFWLTYIFYKLDRIYINKN